MNGNKLVFFKLIRTHILIIKEKIEKMELSKISKFRIII
jgi:hypothetical protein